MTSLRLMKGTIVKSRTQWVPVIAVQTLPDKNGQPSKTSFSYLSALCHELRRYYADLRALGITYTRPVIIEHDTEAHADDMNAPAPEEQEERRLRSRRTGSILDAEVRKFSHTTLTPDGKDARWTLFIKVEWTKAAFDAIQNKELEHVSIHTLPKYTDHQTEQTYAPFIWELSETTKPLIKDFHLGMTLNDNVLRDVGLRLSEYNQNPRLRMNEEQILELIERGLEAALAPMVERLTALETMVAEMVAGGDEEVEANDEGDETPAPEGEAPTDDATAPEAPSIAANEQIARLEARMDTLLSAMERLGQRRTAPVPGSQAPAGIQASVKPKMTPNEAFDKAEAELGANASMAAIAKKAKSYLA